MDMSAGHENRIRNNMRMNKIPFASKKVITIPSSKKLNSMLNRRKH